MKNLPKTTIHLIFHLSLLVSFRKNYLFLSLKQNLQTGVAFIFILMEIGNNLNGGSTPGTTMVP